MNNIEVNGHNAIDHINQIFYETKELDVSLEEQKFNNLFFKVKEEIKELVDKGLKDLHNIDFSINSNQLLIKRLQDIKIIFQNIVSMGINQNSANEVIDCLELIDKEIFKTELSRITTDYFVYKSNLSGKLRIIFEKFTNLLLNNLKQKVSQLIFTASGSLKKQKSLHIKIQIIEGEIKKLDHQISLIQKKIDKIKIKQQCTNDLEAEIIELEFLLQKIGELTSEKKNVLENLDQFRSKLDKINNNLHKAEVVRVGLCKIGGKSVKIDLPNENVKLDGMYISVNEFRNKLKESGAKVYSLNDGEKTIQGFYFKDRSEFDRSSIMGVLLELGAFSTEDQVGSGWAQVETESGEVLLLREEEINDLTKKNIILGNEILSNNCNLKIKEIEDQFPPENQQGTVLLTSGSNGLYEMHKREIIAFLLRGMNVMTFNFRGYGESTGNPTGEGLKRDMKAAYDYLKHQHQIMDNKLMIKALCLSGGPASYLAAEHPDAHLFLDQSFSDFANIIFSYLNQVIDSIVKQDFAGIKEMAEKLPFGGPDLKQGFTTAVEELNKNSIKRILVTWFLKNFRPLINFCIRILVPSWSVASQISKVKGQTGLLLTTEDSLIDVERDIFQNYAASINAGHSDKIAIYQIAGKHADSWLKAKEAIAPVKIVNAIECDLIKQAFLKKYPIFEQMNFVPISEKDIGILIPIFVEQYKERLLGQHPEIADQPNLLEQ